MWLGSRRGKASGCMGDRAEEGAAAPWFNKAASDLRSAEVLRKEIHEELFVQVLKMLGLENSRDGP